MSKVLINEDNLISIANAIRNKSNETITYKPSQMSGVLNKISKKFSPEWITFNAYNLQIEQNRTSLNLSWLYTNNMTDMSYMFYYRRNLQILDIRNFTFTNITSYTNMFKNVPNDCLIIVKSESEKAWITDKFSNLTNIKTLSEL